MEEDCLELLELQDMIKLGIEDAVPGRLRVRAEIASLQRKANGHCYLELCQSDGAAVVARVKAVIWRSAYAGIAGRFEEAAGSPLKAGLSLVFEASVSYSELYGLSLVISDIDVRHTLGEAELQRRRTLERLQKEGYADMQKELALPAVPRRLAVISAEGAAGFGDFCRHLEQNEFGFSFSVRLFPATMQGEGAPASIIAAISDACGCGEPFDALLLLRGGGSVMDLACFDDFELCAALASCPLPVYTAIGHERDVHAADLVANTAVKTPTALADLFIDALASEDERLSEYRSRFRLAFQSKISARELALERCLHRFAAAVSKRCNAAEAAVASLESRIRSADPRQVLSRGWTLATGASGAVLKSASGVSEGDEICILFSDGRLDCKVENVSLEQ